MTVHRLCGSSRSIIPGSFYKKKISRFSQRLFEMSLKQIREQQEQEEEEGNLQDVMEELTCRFCTNGAE